MFLWGDALAVSMPFAKKLFYSITLMGCSLAFLFTLAEIATRVYYKDSVLQFHLYDTFRTHRLNPDYKLKSHSQKLHSKDGFRSDTEIKLQKDENTIRILMLGGSALYGLGSGSIYPKNDSLKNSETISHRLQEKINRSFVSSGSQKRVEIINAGVISYMTFHHLVYLNQELLKYKPDWVINFDGNNDFYGDNPEYLHWNDYTYGSSQLVPHVNARDLFTPFYLFVRFLGKYSAFIHWSERYTNNVMDNYSVSGKSHYDLQFLDSDYSEKNFEAYAQNTFMRSIWQINKLGEHEKYKHFVVIQPEVVFEDDAKLSAQDLDIKNLTSQRIDKKRIEKMHKMYNHMPLMFKKEKIDTLSLGRIATGNNTNLYWDYCHLSPEGSALVAERIYDYFYPLLTSKH